MFLIKSGHIGKQRFIEDKEQNNILSFRYIKDNALLAFIIWLTSSWINAAGRRSAPLQNYITKDYFLGEEI